MNYMVATSSTTNSANIDTYVNNIDSREHLEAFHYVLLMIIKCEIKYCTCVKSSIENYIQTTMYCL